MSSLDSLCLNSWPPAGSAIWEGFGTFRRRRLVGKSATLETEFDVLVCFFSGYLSQQQKKKLKMKSSENL